MNNAPSAYMRKAFELARQGLYTTAPNPRVGCIIVKDGEVVGSGWHQYAGGDHAETSALAQAGVKAKGATLYVTMEPCAHYGRTPPCCDAIVAAGITKVICATLDPSEKNNGAGLSLLAEKGIAAEVEQCREQAVQLNPGFFSLAERKRPWIRIKMAMSLDGRIALPSGESEWISGEDSRRDIQFWRARSDALMTSPSTVSADNPRLNVRLNAADLALEGEVRQPACIVVDSRLRTDVAAQIYHQQRRVILATCCDDQKKIAEFEQAGAEVWRLEAQDGRVSLSALMKKLADNEMGEIQVEAGEHFAGALMAEGLYDELLLYVAPTLLGDGKSLTKIPGINNMAQRHGLQWQDITRVGDDLRIIAVPKNPEKERG